MRSHRSTKPSLNTQGADQERKRRQAVRRDARKLSEALKVSLAELPAARTAAVEAIRAFMEVYATILERHRALRGLFISIRNEGLHGDRVLKEMRDAGVDVEAVNVVFSASGRSTPFSDVLRPTLVTFPNEGAEGSAFDTLTRTLGFN